VPEVLALGADPGGVDVLVLEWIEPGSAQPATADRLGHGLATLHAFGATGFGREHDCFIGSLPQRNTPLADVSAPDGWTTFWFTRRIEPLAALAYDSGSLPGAAADLVPRLGEKLPDRAGPPEPPARLHGDLWTGNVVVDHTGEPWVVDPAPYGGHREADLGMLHLFGQPAAATIAAYEEVWPLADGWQQRLALWQLEPLLVHTILFGGSYAAQVHDVLRRYA
jgi:fructosamine-3-kinase